ncbi:putative hydrogenase nickel incorporation protein HypA [Sulfuriferula plumbiphila]|uniref:Hydrogenase maturation factor HypA n=1 Tax=Sulfuriferula plumbiphila TaxID=171865 RepID=A0A512L8T7_9PROT|nr:hydrogenase maturation nickel metallochaperone HypA [Sulfuriferula plumbiphila]BBP04288.1 putative hydrogenase nickel incorporation protein HypA [Sulfuriferula plumbiphila]GEP30882.1 putative hydrogenase nickel incorporation protein HypA [Sulfuriferula plumbiphila]
MHELSITRNIVAIVSEHAAGQRVTRVRLQIGQLSAIMPEAIRFCFDLCAAGTLAEGAKLEIDETPGRARCDACGEEVALTALVGRCPACGTGILRITAGEEMLIREIEMNTEEASCA